MSNPNSNKRQKTTQTSYEEAKERLQELFLEGEGPPEKYQSVLDTLQDFPLLAKEYFLFNSEDPETEDEDGEIQPERHTFAAKPLSLVMLRCKPLGFEMVKAIGDIDPDAINCAGRASTYYDYDLERDSNEDRTDDLGMFPLYLACKEDMSDDIVEYLAQHTTCETAERLRLPSKFRIFWRARTRRGQQIPKLSLRKVKTIWELSPEFLQPAKTIFGTSVLDDLVEAGYSLDVIDYALERLPNNERTVFVHNAKALSKEQLQHVKKVVHHCSVKRLGWSTAGPDGLELLHSCLGSGEGTADTLDAPKPKISALQIVYRPPNGSPYFIGLAQQLLNWKQNLEELTIQAELPDEEDYDIDEKAFILNDIEKALISLCQTLGANKTVKSLTIEPPCIKSKKPMQALAKAMNKNCNLEKISILDGNALKKFPSYKRVLGLAKLNGCGRAVAQNPLTPPSVFVQLLVDVCRKYRKEKDRHSMQYGLLRESPGLWSAASVYSD